MTHPINYLKNKYYNYEQEVNEVLNSVRTAGKISTEKECYELTATIDYLQNKFNNYDETEAKKQGDKWWEITKLCILADINDAQYILLSFLLSKE